MCPDLQLSPQLPGLIVELAGYGVSSVIIAKLVGRSKRHVNRILKGAIERRVLSLYARRYKGGAHIYTRGPLWPTEKWDIALDLVPPGSAGGSASPPETEVPDIPVRFHNIRFKLPVFEDELQYADRNPESATYGQLRPWNPTLWDDAKSIPTPGVRRYHFRESRYGAWEIVYFARPRAFIRGKGKGAKLRKHVATLILYPAPLTGPAPDILAKPKEIAFSAAVDLLGEIARNRRLSPRAIPESIGPEEGEFGFEIRESRTDPIPKGMLSRQPLIWKDDSPREGKRTPELETRDVAGARAIYTTLSLARIIPNLPTEWESLKSEVADMKAMLAEILRRLP